MTRHSVPALAHYLDTHARWAANNHPAYDELHADLRALHATLEVATQRRRRPTRLPASCFDCRTGTLYRLVDPATGLEDEHATCSTCREQYDASRYTLALAEAAERAAWVTFDDGTYGTVAAVAHELGRSHRTVRTWRDRGQVRSEKVAGIVFVHVQDTRDVHGERAKGRTA